MGLRELLILLLILAIVGVILRGLFVAIRARRGQLRVQLDKNIPEYDPEELTLSELPNGGARSVERSFAHVVQKNSEFSAKDRRKIASGEHAIPVLMDTVGEDDEEDEIEELPRQSGVATARESARQKHMMGQRQAAAEAEAQDFASSVSAISVTHQDVELSVADVDDERDDDYDEDDFDDDYDDPLDSHVFVDDDNNDDDDEFIDDEAPSEDSVDPDGEGYDDDEDDYDDAPSEDSADPDGFDTNEAWDDEDDEDEDEDDFEEPKGWEDEDDAEDPELEVDAVEFDEVYSDASIAPAQTQTEDFDDDGWDDDSAQPEQEEEVSAPRRWLQWAGDKISNLGAGQDEPVREREFNGEERADPVLGLDDFEDEPDTSAKPAPAPAPAPKKVPLDKSRQAQLFADDDEEIETDAAEAPLMAPAAKPERAARKAPEPKARLSEPAPEAPKEYSEVLVINVVAKPDRDFHGIDLLPALLASGLRFGDMSIFHRHFDNSAQSPVVFSVANMLNPGTFDLNQINDFATRGLCFFMTLPNAAHSMQAFDLMLDAAQSLRIALDGDLKDDNRSVMTAQTIEHYRQRVRDFDLRQLRQSK